MNLDALSKVCFYVSIITIVLGVLAAFAMIWEIFPPEMGWKPMLSLAVILGAAMLIMNVIKLYSKK